MKLSLNWIKDFVDIPAKYSPKALSELLTLRTCEVEAFEDQTIKFANMVVGKAIKIRPHPNADKLRLVDTDIGGQTVQVVCGGINLKEGMCVPVALPGAVVNWHGAGETLELKETKIRGEKSFGMICAGEEIGLSKSPPENIVDLSVLLASYGLPVPKPGTPLSKALGMDDIILEIDNKSITHRPDLWGHYGMAREFSAFLGKKLKPLNPKIIFPKTGPKVKVEITNKDIAYRFLSVIVTGIKVEESPEWLKNRLLAVGMRPVNNIVDITNYVMLETGYPMHAFDRNTVKTDGFVVRYAKDGEIIETLDHKKRRFTNEDALITNGQTALGIAGVMGGLNSEISPRTTEIILEVGNWNPVMIRKTAQRHGLRTDAAQRFEKGLDPELALVTFNRACELLLSICKGAKFAGPPTDVYPRKYKPVSVTIDVASTNKKIGSVVPEKEMISHLKALEFDAKKAGKGKLKVKVPSFRATKDVNIEDDIVEEVARMHGYEKIVPILPFLPIKLPIPNIERNLKNHARDILSLGLGFTETSLYSFYGASEITKCLLPKDVHVLIKNPLTEDQTHMRVTLLPNLLKAAAVNLKNQDSFKLYEIGRTYIKGTGNGGRGTGYFPREEKFICGIIVKPQGKKEIFYEALGALQSFLDRFPAKARIDISATPPPYAHPSKCATAKVNGKEVAIIYEVHPQVLNNFYVDESVAAFEINFTQLVRAGQLERSYKPLPRFPGMEIDISTLVPKQMPVREIIELIAHTDKILISKIDVIDIFEDKSLGEGKKSVTVRVLLQSPERTLTDDEMKQVQERIFKTLQNSGFVIRGL